MTSPNAPIPAGTLCTLTERQIQSTRAASRISRETYEAAMNGDVEARSRVCMEINAERHRRFVEDMTP